jgi:hypothetical protein
MDLFNNPVGCRTSPIYKKLERIKEKNGTILSGNKDFESDVEEKIAIQEDVAGIGEKAGE